MSRVMCPKDANWIANNVDSDQPAPQEQSDLGTLFAKTCLCESLELLFVLAVLCGWSSVSTLSNDAIHVQGELSTINCSWTARTNQPVFRTCKYPFSLQVDSWKEGKLLSKKNWDTLNYRNDPKFSDREAWANSADPDQTAPSSLISVRLLGAVWLGSTLFAIPSASFRSITVW